MTEKSSPETWREFFSEKVGIPVRNIWHMLLYAWDLAQLIDRWSVEVEESPNLDALFARILVGGMRRQIRQGLGRAYRTHASTLRGIRGRIDFDESLRRLTFSNGAAHCRFQEFSVNVPRNQIIRTTLAVLAQNGQLGPNSSGTTELLHDLRRLVRGLDGIDQVPNAISLIGRQHLGRNEREYRIMLNICELVLRSRMPTTSAGAKTIAGLNYEAMKVFKIYEKFVASFYRHQLHGWTVRPQSPMGWNTESDTALLPKLIPDLQFHQHGTGRLVVLDTKFTAASLIQSPYSGTPTFNSSHLYQMYAYLRSQDDIDTHHRSAEGILLYPTVNQMLDETIVLQGHSVRFVTVDLSEPWSSIETQLINLFSSS